MADTAVVRAVRLRFWVAVLLVLAAACGSADDEASSATDGAVSAPVPSGAGTFPVPPGETAEALACQDGLLPALAAIDRATGEFQWVSCSADRVWRQVRGAGDDIVYVESIASEPSNPRQPRDVIAVDAQTGTELWRITVPRQQLGWPPGPFDGGGVVVVQVDDDAGAPIVGVDARSGDTRWRVDLTEVGAPDAGTPLPSVIAPLANTDDVVVVSVPDGLIGLDRRSGEARWSNDVYLLDESQVGVARGPAAVDGSTVIIPAASELVSGVLGCPTPSCPSSPPVTIPVGPSALVAVDATTGATLWEGGRLDHPVAADGYVVGYVRSAGRLSSGPDSQVIVVDAATGEQLWTAPGMESYGDLWAIGDGAVYVRVVLDDNMPGVVAYELDSGDERWRLGASPDGIWLGDPQQVAIDGVVLLALDLALLSTADGTTRWSVAGPRNPDNPMSSVGHNSASVFVSFNSMPWGD